jgi:hypothetical protein
MKKIDHDRIVKDYIKELAANKQKSKNLYFSLSERIELAIKKSKGLNQDIHSPELSNIIDLLLDIEGIVEKI